MLFQSLSIVALAAFATAVPMQKRAACSQADVDKFSCLETSVDKVDVVCLDSSTGSFVCDDINNLSGTAKQALAKQAGQTNGGGKNANGATKNANNNAAKANGQATQNATGATNQTGKKAAKANKQATQNATTTQ